MDNHRPLTPENLTRAVHRALHHLYDPVELRLNSLAGWLGLTRGDTAEQLRSELLAGITALKPGPRVPVEASAWRVYQVLCYRFEEQSSQEEVADQMAISARQVRRLEHTAIRALAAHLAAHHNLPVAVELETPIVEAPAESPPAHEQELDWLRRSYTPETADVYQLVDSAVQTAAAMITSTGGRLETDLNAGLPAVRGQVTTLRQVLLNLLLAAEGKRLRLSARRNGRNVEITVAAEHPSANSIDLLALAQRLAELSGGSVAALDHSPGEAPYQVRLDLPVAERIAVLVVDDNEDSLHLFERCLEGTPYAFNGVRDPLQAVELAESCGVRVIVLDIMLPDVDGWELLGRLRTHPALSGVPVIISTILPHEQLALSLGAAAFLRKPVAREALLEMLERLTA